MGLRVICWSLGGPAVCGPGSMSAGRPPAVPGSADRGPAQSCDL